MRNRMSCGQPDVERNDTRFNAESQEKQHNSSRLLSASQLQRNGAEAGEFGVAADVNQQRKAKQQTAGINVRHDDVQQSRSSGLPVLVVERNQPVSGKRHHFTRNEKQERVGSGKYNRQAEKQKMEQETEDAEVPLALEFFQVA